MNAVFLFSRTSHSEEETFSLGEKLAVTLKPGTVLCLEGELGAGKTTFVRGILSGLGWKGMVRSPSFVLIIPYETAPPLVHADIYRLAATDVEDTGLSEYLDGEHIVVIEWADRMDKTTLDDYLLVAFKGFDELREISFYGSGNTTKQINANDL